MNNLGFLYRNGYDWFEKAAELGNASAMNNLGFLYQNGWGVSKAKRWYEKVLDNN
ncbi:hypothetical protein BKA69DRAFT_1105614 [Paraphysoderma sedebokerense]|nr:hypothetical protein BKA69DRAFT_1105614 [Paraphysoderma sedebokerense]